MNRTLAKALRAGLGPLLTFDRLGYHVNAATFEASALEVDLRGKRVVVTGANGGLGFAAARALGRLGATVVMVCRDPGRGARAREALVGEGVDARLELADMGDLASVRALAERLEGPIAALVHNAGALVDSRSLSAEGLESTFACHVVGPLLLTTLCAERLAGGRVIFVSSGGMYLAGPELPALLATEGPFDGVRQYARAKRVQVELAPRLAAALPAVGIYVMHPGWANTPGVERSLPRFHALSARLLRSPEEGADTVVWLAAAREIPGPSGSFWADRRLQPTSPVPGTRASADELDALEALLRARGAWPAA